MVQSGLLHTKHVFYELVKAFYFGSLSSIFPETNFQEKYPSLSSCLATNQFLHGKSATHLFHGKQDSTMVTCKQWIESRNFGGLSPRYITSSTPAPSITNGVSTV